VGAALRGLVLAAGAEFCAAAAIEKIPRKNKT
jgi:hypothetical protein